MKPRGRHPENALNAVKVKNLRKPGRYADGNGLYVVVDPPSDEKRAGAKRWVLRTIVRGKRTDIGLGSVQLVTLSEAREQARAMRALARQGGDPLAARREQRAVPTFKESATQFIAIHEAGWRNEKHRQQWRNTLRDYAYPTLGNRPVSEITGALITEALGAIWATKAETSSRVRQRIERIVQWEKDGRPLPAPSKTRRVQHHKALPWQELPAFISELRAMTSISAKALEFTVLTAARTGATIGAKWPEIDLDAKVWTVPAKRAGTKLTKDHRVPLPDRAIEILAALPREVGNDHVFVGAIAGNGLSNMAMLELLRGIKGDDLTVHGFRSAFKDWSAEATAYPNIVSEMALAHTVADRVEAAYRRGDLFEKRKRLMRDWATYLSTDRSSGEVVGIRGAA